MRVRLHDGGLVASLTQLRRTYLVADGFASCRQGLGPRPVSKKGRMQVVNKLWVEQVSNAIRQLVLGFIA
ncbi:hypothetical protein Y032_0180g779 [Ancylostoma ceylanicum]|uniref:Uncharacterized protein n=1 Tax=Ancylostoma ceylanicum TaxID=53326 RepID=A0A016SSU4_9BILA|nr:hypothetical protein Y032_0180g779 [Ancylostoma ceylanicum]